MANPMKLGLFALATLGQILSGSSAAVIARGPLDTPGTNCDAVSSNCEVFAAPGIGGSDQQIPALARMISESVDDNRLYNNGEQIACIKGTVLSIFPNSVCAFLEKTTGGVLGSDIKALISALDCGACGMISTGFFAGDLNIDHGLLKVDATTNTACGTGVC